MSMTWEEALDIIENKIQIDVRFCTKEEVEQYQEALTMALAALRPVSRERVKKVLRGEWLIGEPDVLGVPIHCSRCGWGSDHADPRKWMDYGGHIFCGRCGVPMTDEAVEMVTERMNKLYD